MQYESMWDTIVEFWKANEASIIISLAVGAVFFVLGPIGLWFSGKRVKREKLLKAKGELLDLLEGMLVNNEQLDVSKLLTLFRSVERNNGINLGEEADLQDILEDLALRFAKSKHLPPDRKDLYTGQINKLLGELQLHDRADTDAGAQRKLPKSYKSILEELREEAGRLGSETLDAKIDLLEKRLLTKGPDPFQHILGALMEKPYFRIAGILYLGIVLIIIFIKFLIPILME